MPEFVFNYSQEPELKSLQEHLSEDSFAELSNQVDLKKVKSFTELKQTLETTLKKHASENCRENANFRANNSFWRYSHCIKR